MLTRIYTDNFRCLVNFDMPLAACRLIVGRNGSGKSTVLDVIDRLARFVSGDAAVEESFPTGTLTRWQSQDVQRFEIDAQGMQGVFRYQLDVEHERPTSKCRVAREHLTFEGKSLYSSKNGDAQLFRDKGTLGPAFPIDWHRSGISMVHPRGDNTRLTWFRERMRHCLVLRIDPYLIASTSQREATSPGPRFEAFASWYRSLVQEHPEAQSALFADLKEVLPRFESLWLERSGPEARTLRLDVLEGAEPTKVSYPFDVLSEGERTLVALYAVLHLALASDATICIDEPDNFVAHAEIQPWLAALREHLDASTAQAILTSHHPEVIDYLAHDSLILIERADRGPTRVAKLEIDPSSGMSASQLISKGWARVD